LHFQQSAFDECTFYHGTTIFIIYTDDGILIDPCQDTINCRIHDTKTLFEIEIQGNLEDYLGIHITTRDDGSKEMTQPHLIDSILMDLNLLSGNPSEAQSASIRHLPSMPSRKSVADTNGERSFRIIMIRYLVNLYVIRIRVGRIDKFSQIRRISGRPKLVLSQIVFS
jgi:hypothetical protein